MPARSTRQKLKYYLQFFPFTFNTLLLGAAIWGAWWLLHKPPVKKGAEETFNSMQPFIQLMAGLSAVFVGALIALSLLSAIVAWVYFLLYNYSGSGEGGLQLSFETDASRKGRSPRLYMNAAIRGILRPMLGFVKGRLFYDDYRLTDTFSLLSNKRKRGDFWREGIGGRARLLLPDIKEYELRGGFLFFEDMLRLLRLPAPQKVQGQFYQPPILREAQDDEVNPKKTETLDVRIDQMRRVEGELLNYKDFEAGDDVRRIVWKVYARNRELVVRVPERFEPYASHLYFYASFAAGVKRGLLGDAFLKEMLNYYKNSVWTIWDALSQKEWEMRYLPDQQFTLPQTADDREKAARIIANSEWLQGASLREYFNPKQGTVLTISSLTEPRELAEILEKSGAGTILYFVKLSNAFRHFAPLGWLARLIFLPPQNRLRRVRSRWLFSPTRALIRGRERELETMLSGSEITYAVI